MGMIVSLIYSGPLMLELHPFTHLDFSVLFNASPNTDMEKSAANLLDEYCHGNVSDYDRGLALYVCRVIGSIWTRPIMKQT
jgi:hypothetical protein